MPKEIEVRFDESLVRGYTVGLGYSYLPGVMKKTAAEAERFLKENPEYSERGYRVLAVVVICGEERFVDPERVAH